MPRRPDNERFERRATKRPPKALITHSGQFFGYNTMRRRAASLLFVLLAAAAASPYSADQRQEFERTRQELLARDFRLVVAAPSPPRAPAVLICISARRPAPPLGARFEVRLHLAAHAAPVHVACGPKAARSRGTPTRQPCLPLTRKALAEAPPDYFCRAYAVLRGP